MTAPLGEQRVGYRSHGVWFWPVFWLGVLAARWLLGLVGPLIFWGLGVALLETNAILTALRARRGLTLAPDGITWHKYEVFLPWSNVAAVEQSAFRHGPRLVVRVIEPEQALETVAHPARPEIRANLRWFGAPIALRAGRLALPAVQVLELADRFRQAYAAAGGFKGVATQHAPSQRVRARRTANLWTGLAGAGLVTLLLGATVAGAGAVPGKDPGLEFEFQRTTGPGYMDQVLFITNHGLSAVAPTLAFVPFDGAGRRVPGVTVRTAFGSDRGMVTVAPHSVGSDVLAFDGPGFRQVTTVRVSVRSTVRVRTPTWRVEELHASRLSAGRPAEPLEDFDTLAVTNTNSVPVSVRLVCILWEDPPPGATQQMLESVPIGGLIQLAPLGQAEVPVTGRGRRLARDCGSVKVYYSR